MTCQQELRAAGSPYPRTCQDCGLGPCKRAPQRPAADVTALKVAEAPAKADLLALIDELRSGIEDGSIISLVAIPVHPNREWSTRSAGEIRTLELAGMLSAALFDAHAAMKVR